MLKKIGKIFLILFAISKFAFAAISIEANVNSDQIGSDETIQLNVTINSDKNFNNSKVDFKAPAFNVRTLPLSTSQSIQIINGKTSINLTRIYKYELTPKTIGKYKITDIKAEVDGSSYKASDIEITVSKENQANPYRGQKGINNKEKQDSQPANLSRNKGGFFLEAKPSKTSIYKGEQIKLYYNFYTNIQTELRQAKKLPELKGFLKKEYEVKRSDKIITKNGIKYSELPVLQYKLTPLEVGTLQIDPLSIEIVYRKTRNEEDDDAFSIFRMYMAQPIQEVVSSKQIAITVKPLPEIGRPPSFTGAVGEFSLKSEISTLTTKAGQPVTYKVTITGSSSIESVKSLNLKFPDGFEIYEDKTSIQNISDEQISKTFEYLLIPKKMGEITIPELEFTYFDTKTENYKTLKTEFFTLKIDEGNYIPNTNIITKKADEVVNETPKINEEIRFLYTTKQDSNFKKYLIYLLLLVNIILVFSIITKFIISEIRKNSKKENLPKLLADIEKLDINSNEFSINLLAIIYKVIAIIGKTSPHGLTREEIVNIFNNKKFSENILNEILSIIEICNFSKYSNSSNSDNSTNLSLREKALSTLSEINKRNVS